MNILSAYINFKELLKQGNALKSSSVLVNAEVTASALYGVISTAILLLNDFGIDVSVGATDLHTMANGWTITASFAYSLYRIITNTLAGFKPQ